MKKRLLICIAVVIALFVGLKVLNLSETDVEGTDPVIEMKPERESQQSDSKLTTEAPANLDAIAKLFKANPNEIEDLSRQVCFKRIQAQVEQSHDFLGYAKDGISKVVGEWYYRQDPSLINVDSNSPKQEKFFLGLARAGMLDGIEVEKNRAEALQLLLQVAKEDPKNSAPLLYAAAIRKQNGDEAGAQKLLALAQNCDYFDSYVSDFVRALQSQVETSADLVTATGTWMGTPVPNYLIVKESFSKNKKLASQLTAKALKVNGENPFEMNYILIEYGLGRSALEKMGEAKDLPTTKEFITKTMRYSNSFISALEKNCEIKDLDPTVAELKRALATP